MTKPTAILTADWHLTESTPTCRKDDWFEVMRKKLTFISDIQKEYNIPIWHAGDLFDHWKPPPFLLSFALEYLPNGIVTVLGNHDLPQHNLELYDKCGVSVLEKAGKVEVKDFYHWEKLDPNNPPISDILITHIMTWQGKNPWPGCEDLDSKALLDSLKHSSLVLTGHNHRAFIEKAGKRILVNPGSIFRMTADQVDHEPRIYLWYSETNSVEPVFLPIEKGVVSREHIEMKKEKDERIQSFVSNLNNNWKPEIDFEENLRAAFAANDTGEEIKNIIWKSLEV